MPTFSCSSDTICGKNICIQCPEEMIPPNNKSSACSFFLFPINQVDKFIRRDFTSKCTSSLEIG